MRQLALKRRLHKQTLTLPPSLKEEHEVHDESDSDDEDWCCFCCSTRGCDRCCAQDSAECRTERIPEQQYYTSVVIFQWPSEKDLRTPALMAQQT